jgi:hypothetical protein
MNTICQFVPIFEVNTFILSDADVVSGGLTTWGQCCHFINFSHFWRNYLRSWFQIICTYTWVGTYTLTEVKKTYRITFNNLPQRKAWQIIQMCNHFFSFAIFYNVCEKVDINDTYLMRNWIMELIARF